MKKILLILAIFRYAVANADIYYDSVKIDRAGFKITLVGGYSRGKYYMQYEGNSSSKQQPLKYELCTPPRDSSWCTSTVSYSNLDPSFRNKNSLVRFISSDAHSVWYPATNFFDNPLKIVANLGDFDNTVWQDKNIPYNKIDVLNIAFADIDTSGAITPGIGDYDIIFSTIEKNARAKNPKIKILLSISPNADYNLAGLNMAQFANSTIDLLQRYHLDGIDLDLENDDTTYPNILSIIKNFKSLSHDAYIVSLTPNGYIARIIGSNWPQIMQYTDWVNTMNYGEDGNGSINDWAGGTSTILQYVPRDKVNFGADVEGGFGENVSKLTDKALTVKNSTPQYGGIMIWRIDNDNLTSSSYGSLDLVYDILND